MLRVCERWSADRPRTVVDMPHLLWSRAGAHSSANRVVGPDGPRNFPFDCPGHCDPGELLDHVGETRDLGLVHHVGVSSRSASSWLTSPPQPVHRMIGIASPASPTYGRDLQPAPRVACSGRARRCRSGPPPGPPRPLLRWSPWRCPSCADPGGAWPPRGCRRRRRPAGSSRSVSPTLRAKTQPSGPVDSSTRSPPCARAASRETCSPRPLPSLPALGPNASNSRGRTSGLHPRHRRRPPARRRTSSSTSSRISHGCPGRPLRRCPRGCAGSARCVDGRRRPATDAAHPARPTRSYSEATVPARSRRSVLAMRTGSGWFVLSRDQSRNWVTRRGEL